MLKQMQAVYNTFLFYGAVLLLPLSPGVLAWKLFRNKRGKIPFICRDLICDTETLMALPKSEGSLDEFTTAFSPFIPLLTLNGGTWSVRRKILAQALRKMHIDPNLTFDLPHKRGDIYWDVFEGFFKVGFKLIFGRAATPKEFEEMYPGVADINRLIKRQVGFPDMDVRWKLYQGAVALQSEKTFIFADCAEFNALSEIDRVSIIVEDLLTSICIQCSDLLCHLLLLFSSYPDAFKSNLENCINETLRLYPLTDIWTRKSTESEKGWIASLIQLNRTGWSDPDNFQPERWHLNDHPPLISWGFDARSCPASKVGYNLTKTIFQNLFLNRNLWIQPASNYIHDRTFSAGCQVWVGEGTPPASAKWKFQGKWKGLFQQWLYTRLRVLDQNELW